jgi:phosphoribosylformylglycinamidine cyclo-ligase
MVLVVDPADADRAMRALTDQGERVWRIGRIDRRSGGEPQTIVA